MSLIANAIEAAGLPTLVIGTVRDIMALSPAPRAVFIDFPVGRTFGHPGAPDQHQAVLRRALEQLDKFTEYGQIVDLPLAWAGADRSWEEMIRQEVAPRPAG